VMLYL